MNDLSLGFNFLGKSKLGSTKLVSPRFTYGLNELFLKVPLLKVPDNQTPSTKGAVSLLNVPDNQSTLLKLVVVYFKFLLNLVLQILQMNSIRKNHLF